MGAIDLMGLGPTQGPESGKLPEKWGDGVKSGFSEKLGVYDPGVPCAPLPLPLATTIPLTGLLYYCREWQGFVNRRTLGRIPCGLREGAAYKILGSVIWGIPHEQTCFNQHISTG